MRSKSISGRAGHAFTVHTMIEGFACHARGVELTKRESRHAEARVRGKRLHDVALDVQIDKGRLAVTCSCAAESMGIVCKHAWAALLEVDREGGLEDVASIRGVLPVVAMRKEDRAEPAPALKSKSTPPPPARESAKESAEAAKAKPPAKATETAKAKAPPIVAAKRAEVAATPPKAKAKATATAKAKSKVTAKVTAKATSKTTASAKVKKRT